VIADTVAAVLVVVIIAYAALAGADFGGGIWDLLAGSAERGAAPRRRIDQSVTPVWESNHVWLIIALVLLWTGFPVAFADTFTTLFVPLSVAALGIVLRGAGFAFRAQLRSLRWQAVSGGVFALSSLLTPFFLGTAIGAIVSGRVRGAAGDPVTSWVNPTSLLTGALFVVFSAYLAAVYLAVDSERGGEPGLRAYFTRRAIVAGGCSGVLAGVTMAVLRTSAPRVFTNLTTGRALPLVVVSVLAGAAVLVLLVLDKIALIRPLAAIAVTAVAAGWATAQYPYLLPPRLTIAGAAAPVATEATELVVVIIAVLVAPSFVLLFRLAQAGHLGEPEASPASTPPGHGAASHAAAGRAGAAATPGPWDTAGTAARGGTGPSRPLWLVATVAGAVLAAQAIRRLRDRSRRPSG
jgi:cytochrome bd ubiquinol oxidase subunit II